MPRTLTNLEAAALRARLAESGGREDLSGWACAVLAEICTGSRVPRAIMHPLGFTCIQLYRGTEWGLCLHIWRSLAAQQPALTTTAVHAHSWDLSSQVVCGQLENVEINVVDGSASPTHRVLEITTHDGKDIIRPTQRLVCRGLAESVHVGVGQTYYLPAGTFHLSRPSAAGLTATVLLASYRSASPELALGRLDFRDQMVVRQACPPADLRHIAEITSRDIATFHRSEVRRKRRLTTGFPPRRCGEHGCAGP
jgi:hypothetical protein